MSNTDDFELERLRAELTQEKQMKEMLEQSLGELQLTVDELEKRIDTVSDENNEWKTRYETQTEMNQQLDKQLIMLFDKVDDARRTLKESKMPRSMRNFNTENQEVTPGYLKSLEKDKNALASQMRDMEWKLDQESKAYHKANEERKQYITEINAAKGSIDHMKVRQRQEKDTVDHTGTPRGLGNMNIPQHQRVIDPKKGPIKKTAAVQRLPRLD